MNNWTRRDLLKAGLVTSAAASVLPAAAGAQSPPAAQPGRSQKAPAAATPAKPAPAALGRERLLLDFGWRFALGHADDPAKDFGFGRSNIFAKSGSLVGQLSRTNFDDSPWRAVDLPHDWAIDLDFQMDRAAIGTGAKPLGRAYPATSIGWYRRVFDVPAADLGRRLWLEFDGVFRDCIVTLNGHYLGRNLSGYAPFSFDVTDFVTYGDARGAGKNVLVVRVDASEHEGWFYEGAGIYRHVWLVKTHALHVAQGGTFVTSKVGAGAAAVSITTEIDNAGDTERNCSVVSTLVDRNGKVVATARSMPLAVPAGARSECRQQVTLARPALWSVEQPNMYVLLTRVESGNTAVDSYATPFGIRTIRFDPGKGFFLNGEPVKVKGTCNHQDHAGLGAALPDRVQYYRIERLKEMGGNGYRSSHNPPTAELLDACDRLGMLVMDETRMMSSNEEGLSQLERLIRRDRNHPSVIWWSLGNEEGEQGNDRGARIIATMKRLARRLDPTRPVTLAMNGAWGRGATTLLDVMGFNYAGGGGGGDAQAKSIDDFHAKFPKQPCIGTETASTVSTRGIYANDREKGYVSAYDANAPQWGSTAESWWKIYAARAFVEGGFVWTGFDYRGEPTPYSAPCISSHFGIMDTCGFPKDNFYYYKAWWQNDPVLHVFPHWNWPGREGQEIEVWVHSNLEKVELFLNGQSLGAKEMQPNSHLAWKVKYAPGLIEAVGYKAGQTALVARRQTTGAPAGIQLRADRGRIWADGEDVSLVDVRVVDSAGRVVPVADNEISFKVSGSGKIIGVGNGNPSSQEPDRAPKRKAFSGLCLAIVQATKEAGEIRIEATSPGLASASLVITGDKANPRPAQN